MLAMQLVRTEPPQQTGLTRFLAQPIDLWPGFIMSPITKQFYQEYRKLVSVVVKDRIFINDIDNCYHLIYFYTPFQFVMEV